LRAPAQFGLDARIALDQNTIQLLSANVISGGVKLQVVGSIGDLTTPHGEFDLTAALPIEELSKMFRLPIEPRGTVEFQGHASAGGPAVDGQTPYRLTGRLSGKGLAYLSRGIGYIHQNVEISGISLATYADVNPKLAVFSNLDIATSQGRFHGTAEVTGFERLALQGAIDGLSIAELGRLAGRETGNLNGTLSGPVQLQGLLTPSGLLGVTSGADLTLKPGDGGLPVEGALAMSYDQRSGKIALGNSHFAVGASEASVSGTLGETLAVHVVSRNLNDAIPVLRALGAAPPAQWPAELNAVVARVDASVTGSIENAKVSGKADVEKL
jgi:hypothetical protein